MTQVESSGTAATMAGREVYLDLVVSGTAMLPWNGCSVQLLDIVNAGSSGLKRGTSNSRQALDVDRKRYPLRTESFHNS